MTTWINYAETGYDPSDGLLGGRWMFDDERRCQVWVQIEPARPEVQKTGPRKSCLDCSAPVDRRALRCRIHASIEKQRLKREHMRKVRSEVAA